MHLSHDRFVKKVFSEPLVARDFLGKYLPEVLLEIIDLDTLAIEPGSFVDSTLKESLTDMLFSAKGRDQEDVYLYTLLEHQTSPDYWMTFRIVQYELSILERYKKQKPTKNRLPLIYTIVFYTGKTAYTAPKNFFELFHDPTRAMAIFNQARTVVHLQKIDDEVLREQRIAGIFQFFMKNIREVPFFPYFEMAISDLKMLEKMGLLDYVESMIFYIMHKAELPDKKWFIQELQTYFLPETGDKIMTLAEQFIAEGIEKGIEQGIERGIAQAAKAMLNEGIPIGLVIKTTGLSKEDLNKLGCKEQKKTIQLSEIPIIV